MYLKKYLTKSQNYGTLEEYHVSFKKELTKYSKDIYPRNWPFQNLKHHG